MSDGAVRLGPGTLYGAVKRLVADGLIEETDQRSDPELDDSRRRYYRLIGLGERVCDAELQRLQTLLARAKARGSHPRLGEA